MKKAELASLGGHSAEHQVLLFLVALGAFAALVLVLTLYYRRSCERLELEEIDDLLREEEVL